MNLRCRPREGGDPYTVSLRCGVAGERSKVQWLWVPASAGTTTDGSVPTTVEEVSHTLARGRTESESTASISIPGNRGLVALDHGLWRLHGARHDPGQLLTRDRVELDPGSLHLLDETWVL